MIDAGHDLCSKCCAVLSHYRPAGEVLCAPCSRAAADSAPQSRVLGSDRLVDAVAGVLLVAHSLNPNARVHIRVKLHDLGIEADHVDIRHAVLKLERRYGMRIDCAPPEAGHRLEHWPFLGLLMPAYQRLVKP